MNSSSNVLNINFDIERAETAARHYSKSTDSNCQIIDNVGNIIFDTECTTACSQTCRRIQQQLGENSFCKQSRIYGAFESKRFGGKYIYLCPMGLVNWASPITTNGNMIGALIAGTFKMMKSESKLIVEILKKYGIVQAEQDAILEELDAGRRIEPSKVTSLSEMLLMLTCTMSDLKHCEYLQYQSYQKNIYSISEYIQLLKKMDEKHELNDIYPFLKEKDMVLALECGNMMQAQRMLNEILGFVIFRTGTDLKFMKARIMELMVLLSRTILDNCLEPDLILQLNSQFIWEIQGIQTIEELSAYSNKMFSNLLRDTYAYKAVQHSDAIYKSINYMKTNYMRKITLEDVSSHVHFSTAYYSRIFKEEMKTNFTDYLNDIRIEHSKSLLLSKDVEMSAIASLVGFADQSYYSKVFKRLVGVTPGYYRKYSGRIRMESEV